MTEEVLTDAERRRLLLLAINALPNKRDQELCDIIAKIAGTDTVLVVRRAYPSSPERRQALVNAHLGGKPCG
jgi:hypothetical protein